MNSYFLLPKPYSENTNYDCLTGQVESPTIA